jgi:hypothetical protein
MAERSVVLVTIQTPLDPCTQRHISLSRRRILADLLIELTLGVDADIARSLARAQSRMRRR